MKGIIIYSTKYGSVEKAAKILKSKLQDNIVLANVMKEKVPSLEEFDTVMLGGSIYVGKIQKKLTSYINQHISELLNKKVGLFICAGQEEVLQKELETAFPKELYDYAAAKEVFGHEINLEKATFFDKLVIRNMIGIKQSYSKIDQDRIENFAKKMLADG